LRSLTTKGGQQQFRGVRRGFPRQVASSGEFNGWTWSPWYSVSIARIHEVQNRVLAPKKQSFFFTSCEIRVLAPKTKVFLRKKKKKKKSDRDRFEKTLPVIIKKEFLNFYWRFLFFFFFSFFSRLLHRRRRRNFLRKVSV
jgi:hypothetical protein